MVQYFCKNFLSFSAMYFKFNPISLWKIFHLGCHPTWFSNKPRIPLICRKVAKFFISSCLFQRTKYDNLSLFLLQLAVGVAGAPGVPAQWPVDGGLSTDTGTVMTLLLLMKEMTVQGLVPVISTVQPSAAQVPIFSFNQIQQWDKKYCSFSVCTSQ